MEILQFKKRRRRLKKPVLAILAVLMLIAVIALVFVAFLGGSEGKVKYARIEETRTYTAVVIRDEKLVGAFEKEGGYSVADYCVHEGQSVETGEHIMDVYRLGFSRETELSLFKTRQQIYLAQLEVIGEVRNEQLKSLDIGIENAKGRLSYAVMNGNGEAALAAETELNELLEARRDYLKNETHETETLRALYKEEDDKLDAVLASKRELFAEGEGLVSFYFDDYSAALNADKLNLITTSLVDAATKKDKAQDWIGASTTAAYRLINPNVFYCAFLTASNDALRVAPNTEYPVEIDGYGTFEAVGVASYKSGNKLINIVRIDSGVESLINARKVSLKLKYSAEGLCVEKRAVQYNDGSPYIELMENGKRTGVYVDVLAANADGAIVIARDAQVPPIQEGERYWIPKRLNVDLKKLLGR